MVDSVFSQWSRIEARFFCVLEASVLVEQSNDEVIL